MRGDNCLRGTDGTSADRRTMVGEEAKAADVDGPSGEGSGGAGTQGPRGCNQPIVDAHGLGSAYWENQAAIRGRDREYLLAENTKMRTLLTKLRDMYSLGTEEFFHKYGSGASMTRWADEVDKLIGTK